MADEHIDKEVPDNVYAQERQRRWEQRWATPGTDPFEQWFWTLQRYFNRKVDPEIMEMYRRILGGISVDELQAVLEQYLEKPDIPRDPPKAGLIKALWKERKGIQEEKRQKRNTRSGQADALDRRDKLRNSMFPLISLTLLRMEKAHGIAKPDVPEWMQVIADYVAQQLQNDHPGKELHEVKLEPYFEMGLKLFDEERHAYEEA